MESAVAKIYRLLGPASLFERRRLPRNGGEIWREPFTEDEVRRAQSIIAAYTQQQEQLQ